MRAAPGAPWIKICGVSTFADLETCAGAGATHVGINTWPGSPRCVPPRAVRGLLHASLRLGLRPVLLVLPGSPTTPGEVLHLSPPFVQLLEALPAALAAGLARNGTRIIEARRARADNTFSLPWGDVLLLDAFAPGLPGGSGKAVPRALALQAPRPFVLAGGLCPDNVLDAIRAVSPAGVDAATGVESRPGVKDPGKVRVFCAAAREAFEGQRVRDIPFNGESASKEASCATSPCWSALQSAAAFPREHACDSI